MELPAAFTADRKRSTEEVHRRMRMLAAAPMKVIDVPVQGINNPIEPEQAVTAVV